MSFVAEDDFCFFWEITVITNALRPVGWPVGRSSAASSDRERGGGQREGCGEPPARLCWMGQKQEKNKKPERSQDSQHKSSIIFSQKTEEKNP